MIIPYLIILLFLGALIIPFSKSDVKWKQIIICVCLAVLVLFFGLRGPVGDDYYTYKQYYESLNMADSIVFGPGFWLLNALLRLMHLPFQCLLLAITLVSNLLLVRFVKKTGINAPLMLMISFAMGGIANQIDFIRNFLSIMVFVNSFDYIFEKNPRKYILLNLIGMTFHYSSVIFIPLYWLINRDFKQKSYICIYITVILLSFMHLHFLSFIPDVNKDSYMGHLHEYIDTYSTITIKFSMGTIERILTGLAACLCYKQLSQTKYGIIAINSFMLYTLCYGLFSGYAILGTRLGNLFVYCHWLLWPLLLKAMPNKSLRYVSIGFMCLFMLSQILALSRLAQWEYTLCF